jgi:hypothetical protein
LNSVGSVESVTSGLVLRVPSHTHVLDHPLVQLLPSGLAGVGQFLGLLLLGPGARLLPKRRSRREDRRLSQRRAIQTLDPGPTHELFRDEAFE